MSASSVVNAPSGAFASATAPARPRVLVVDESLDVLRSFSESLAAAGMEAITAGQGEGALERLASETFDTVLTSARMPALDGIALLRAVRERDADLPVVLVTNGPGGALPNDVHELATGGVLLRPVDEVLLVRTVARSVRFCRLARDARRQAPPARGPRPEVPAGPAAATAFARGLSSLYLAWQPIVRGGDGSIHGHEAFVRTLEPSLADPHAFFSVARDLDRLVDLGRAVRRSAALEAVAFPGETLCVNVHPSELGDDGMLDPAAPLSGTARSVVLEVSGRTLPAAGDGLAERLRELRRIGFRIAIDDWGSEEPALGTLTPLAPAVVKLDIPLVRGLDGDRARRERVGRLTAALHDAGIEVAAEGIETVGERHAAVDLGVDLLQGFLFGRPKPVS